MPRIYEAMTTKGIIRVVLMVVLVLMEMMNEHQFDEREKGRVLIIYNAMLTGGHLLITDAVTIGRGYPVSIMSA